MNTSTETLVELADLARQTYFGPTRRGNPDFKSLAPDAQKTWIAVASAVAARLDSLATSPPQAVEHSCPPAADWGGRSTSTHEGWVNELLTLAEHPEGSMPTWARRAMTTIAQGLHTIKAEPVAWWIPKAEQFCMATPGGRPFANAWEPLYAGPQAARDAQTLPSVPPDAPRAWNALRDDTDKLDAEMRDRIMANVRICMQRQYEAGKAAP